MRCRACIAVALVLAIAPAANAATKKPRFFELGVANGPAVVGTSDVAFPINASSVEFIDFGTQPPTQTVLEAPLCRPFLAGYEALTSDLDSAGNGQVLWTCDSEGPPLLEDVASGQVTNTLYLPPALGNSDGSQPAHGSIGRYWIGTVVRGHEGYNYLAYFDPTTYLWLAELKSPRHYANLDDPDLVETMCRPLHRTPFPQALADEGPHFQPYFYDHRYGVGTLAHVRNGLETEDLTVQRCGSRKPRVLCDGACGDAQYSDGLITWVGGNALKAYAPRTGRHYSWSLSAFSTGGAYVRFAHTHQRLVASVLAPGATEWTIWAARMPKH